MKCDTSLNVCDDDVDDMTTYKQWIEMKWHGDDDDDDDKL